MLFELLAGAFGGFFKGEAVVLHEEADAIAAEVALAAPVAALPFVLLGPGMEAVGAAAARAGAVVLAAVYAADALGGDAVFFEELEYHILAFVLFVQFANQKFISSCKLHSKLHGLFFRLSSFISTTYLFTFVLIM
jgi:hypothetical protein